ncbi:MAG TPA: efflux RND transporter permease subunit [Thermoanaerobaculia bacterium]|nr:efflux RND transporter permease subunit [Thermoanaerobaculia bacterium]
MAHGKSDAEIIGTTRNTARFFTETRQISWVLLIGTILWGIFGYFRMPQRKDPDIPPRQALAICVWPGAQAEKVEQLVARRIEEKVAENAQVTKIESVNRTGVTFVYVTLDDKTKDRAKELDDLALKLGTIRDLPQGAGPINFIKDFGDTAALMLTVASPRISGLEVELRAKSIRQAIEQARAHEGNPEVTGKQRVTLLLTFPQSLSPDAVRRPVELFSRVALEDGVLRDPHIFQGPGFIGVDVETELANDALRAYGDRFVHERLRASEIHPDLWPTAAIRDPATTREILASVAGDKYSYRELDDFTDLIARTLKTSDKVSKITRSGLLDEQIYLEYSQERLASYGIRPSGLQNILAARNITLPGGTLEIQGKNLSIDPSGELKSEKEIGDILVPTLSGPPVYLRDLVTVSRAYASPPRFLNFFTRRNPDGSWVRTRAVTVAVQMRPGEKIGTFGAEVDAKLADLEQRLPPDLILAHTSDQPRQVRENIDLFMNSLYEAILLVVLVSLIGFWEWRSALLMALAIPITLAMSFGLMALLGIDLQQVSIASLIIALGLLVDDPVVAGDSIKRELAAGHPPVVAAWLGPTKLATAILYATITNIVAYLPFLLLPGDTGKFLYSLPVVIGAALVSSRIVSMTFIPLLGYYLLRPKAEPSIEERRKRGFAAWYYRAGKWAIHHRWKVLAVSLIFLALGGFFMSRLATQFFPKDLSYLSYVDVWLPEDAPLSATRGVVDQVETVVRETAEQHGKDHPAGAHGGKSRTVLKSLTSFVGGGGPRFWFSVAPEPSQLNYAQVVIEVHDKHDTIGLVGALQTALSARVTGGEVDVRQLETGPPVGIPVAVRFSGETIATLRAVSDRAKDILRTTPKATRVRDNWGAESFAVQLVTDPDRANLAGVTNLDVAAASAAGMNGFTVSTLREGDRQIPIVARLRMEERARLADIRNLYVYSSQGPQKVPLAAVSSLRYGLRTEKIQRRNQFRTVTVSAFPEAGTLPSEALRAALPRLRELAKTLPPGTKMEIGGEKEEQDKGFLNLAIVMAISVAMIFLALVIQFKNAVKPLLVFAAIPYGMVGAVGALWLMGTPFGFMAFLGVASLVGVIVSHVIVLFDFIEERHEMGEPLEEALLDAGIVRLRPVLITVGATVIALFPLAAHGGPLWEPMCYSQIGGLTVATFITLLLVPVLYATFVLDLKLVKWEGRRIPQLREKL